MIKKDKIGVDNLYFFLYIEIEPIFAIQKQLKRRLTKNVKR